HRFGRAIPAEADAGIDLREPVVGTGAVRDLVEFVVGGAPGAAEGIAEAVGVDVVASGDSVGGAVKGIVGGGRAVEIQTKNLPPGRVEIEGRGGIEAVAVVNIELAVGADRDVGDLMRLALGLADHVEQNGQAAGSMAL